MTSRRTMQAKKRKMETKMERGGTATRIERRQQQIGKWTRACGVRCTYETLGSFVQLTASTFPSFFCMCDRSLPKHLAGLDVLGSDRLPECDFRRRRRKMRSSHIFNLKNFLQLGLTMTCSFDGFAYTLRITL